MREKAIQRREYKLTGGSVKTKRTAKVLPDPSGSHQFKPMKEVLLWLTPILHAPA
jgi:hypothetical protein